MKKFGFTLAEVLITLTIIGVVAAVTLPALQANVQEQAAISKYKKTMNILNNIGATLEAQQEFNYSDCAFGEKINEGENATRGIDPATGRLRRQIWAVLNEYAKLDRVATQNIQPGDIGGACLSIDGHEAKGAVVFKDGTAFCWAEAGHSRNDVTKTSYYGIIDINGVRLPNTLSTCGDANCGANKQINDQFRVSLLTTEAVPGWNRFNANWEPAADYMNSGGNFAAVWAFNR